MAGERLLFAGWATTSNVSNRLVRTDCHSCHREILALLIFKDILRQERNGKHETDVNNELKNSLSLGIFHFHFLDGCVLLQNFAFFFKIRFQ